MVAEKEEEEVAEKEEEEEEVNVKVLTTENVPTIPEPQARDDYKKQFSCEQVHAHSMNSFQGYTLVDQD